MTLFQPSDVPSLPDDVTRLYGQFAAGLRAVLGDAIVSFYSYARSHFRDLRGGGSMSTSTFWSHAN